MKMIIATILLACVALAHGDQPTSQPVQRRTLGPELVEFTDLDGWKRREEQCNDTMALYTRADPQAAWSIQLLPANAEVNDHVAVAIVKARRQWLKENASKVLLEPKIVNDKRFDVCVHERFVTKQGTPQDQYHIQKRVGKRVIYVIEAVFNDDESLAKPVHEDGLSAAAKVKAVKKK